MMFGEEKNMSKFLFTIFIVIILCPSISNAQKVEQIYFNRPQGWEMRQTDKAYGTMIVLISPSKNYIIQFVLKEIPNDMQLKTIDGLNDIDESVKKLKAVKHSSEKMPVAGTIGIGAWLSYKNSKSNDHMVHYVLELKNSSTFLTINCIAGEKNQSAALSYFEKYKPETSGVINSIKFLDNN